MGVETEVKVALFEAADFVRGLERCRAVVLRSRHFEDNWLLDYADGRLRDQRCLLRIRSTGGQACMTFKGPPDDASVFKVREELETGVGSPRVAAEIFGRLGMRVWFRYQKYRTEYLAGGSPGGEIHVALDETPIGVYAEFEGDQAGIRSLAKRLGFEESQFLRDSYYGLYAAFCRNRGCAVRHMVFTDEAAGDAPPEWQAQPNDSGSTHE